MKIDSQAIPLAYSIAKEVCQGTLKPSVGVKKLAFEANMNVNSAADYINNLKLMLKGRRFQRTLNYASMDYFLDKISIDYGQAFLRKALLALNQHIVYYEGIGKKKTTAKKMRSLLDKYKETIDSPEYIVNLTQLKLNIETLENFLTSTDELRVISAQKLIKQGICYVAYQVGNELRFAPSRYLGYKGNEPYKYLLDIHGKETNKVIADILDSQPVESPDLDKLYVSYCTKLGFIPSAVGRFGVQRKFWQLKLEEDFPSNDDAIDGFPEGKIVERTHKARERNSKVVELAKHNFKLKHGRLFCQVCKFDYKKVYGKVGDGFIEGHHTKWVSDMPADYKTKPEEIALLCANCHRMVHRKRPWLTMENLHLIIKNNKA
ncbi:HNH endonuclease [Pedobacter sp. MC2016-05]|uniref:HNH endonuclease n=1 Tax=Pedobacter sp. MC2016-05 TaxID=2994474 RepID=UPI002246B2F6|nr:HNH endonuclease [Pedobacter sp. MC2016-05]MCX2472787.1 HNH endonuclease [Pedobacter sp. MC2016-05]